MAHYGISAAITAKTQSKRNTAVEKACVEWIYTSLEEAVPEGSVEDILHDGVALCKLINKLQPGSVDKIYTGSEKYKLMENINKFIAAAQKYGVDHTQLFRTVDLFEKKNVPEVTGGIIALARAVAKHEEWKGPQMEKWVFAQN